MTSEQESIVHIIHPDPKEGIIPSGLRLKGALNFLNSIDASSLSFLEAAVIEQVVGSVLIDGKATMEDVYASINEFPPTDLVISDDPKQDEILTTIEDFRLKGVLEVIKKDKESRIIFDSK